MRRLSHLFILSGKLPLSLSSAVKVVCVYLALLSCLSVYWGSAVAAASEEDGAIPADAIRIRIIANSDSAFDQQVKADVRDQVAGVIESWGVMPATHDEARALIASHLPEIRATAERALEAWQVDYAAEVTLAEVPFPDKMFGGRKYAAGDYEALRITLGGGQGANWWCVLFPPLCLTAATAAEEQPAQQNSVSNARAGTSAKANDGANKGKSVKQASAHVKSGAAQSDVRADAEDAGKPKPRFFLWKLLQMLGDFLKTLFS